MIAVESFLKKNIFLTFLNPHLGHVLNLGISRVCISNKEKWKIKLGLKEEQIETSTITWNFVYELE